MLTETSGAFDFLKEEKENIYTVDDLRVRYEVVNAKLQPTQRIES